MFSVSQIGPYPLFSRQIPEKHVLNLYSSFICEHNILLPPESMMSCPLTVSEPSMLFWDEAVEHAAFSPHHPALSGGFTRVLCPAGADI